MPRLVGAAQSVTAVSQDAVTTTFNSSGTLNTAQYTTSLQYLVIAGGGGGGGSNAGSNHVGAKGSASSIAGTPITTITSEGGGGGGTGASYSPYPYPGISGGSGGGGGTTFYPRGTGTSNQGYPGGYGSRAANTGADVAGGEPLQTLYRNH